METIMYVSDAEAVRLSIAEWRSKIQLERAATIERCKRLRATCDDPKICHRREHDEWELFYKRVRPLEMEVEVMIRALADTAAFEAPPSVILPTKSV
jgi:hypothetical protein